MSRGTHYAHKPRLLSLETTQNTTPAAVLTLIERISGHRVPLGHTRRDQRVPIACGLHTSRAVTFLRTRQPDTWFARWIAFEVHYERYH